MSYPVLRLPKGDEKKILGGYPWVFGDGYAQTAELLTGEKGMLVELRSHRDDFVARGYFNSASKIACRIFTLKRETIDMDFFVRRFEIAQEKREKKITAPYYRLAHSESDGLPGLVVDRFDNALVCQVTTAGMERLQPLWVAALETVFSPSAIVLRNDVPARALEGLKEEVRVINGEIGEPVRLREYGQWYLADLVKGQKTGWFYDQRDNREMVAKLARGKTLLDVYCHSGGFGIAAAVHGAASVTFVDSSAWALEMAKQAAALNDVAAQCRFAPGPAFEVMEDLQKKGARFDIVVADPPAFIPSRKDLAKGLKGYEKVARMAAALVGPGGLFFIASCSHHAARPLFRKAVLAGLAKAGRKGVILKQTGAAGDHPVHPQLPQSEYLKGLLIRL